MRRSLTAAALLAMLAAPFATPAPAAAQGVCGERTKILKQLQQGYEEQPVGMGLAANGAVLEVLTSEAGSWTILVTLPQGATCILATGESWEELRRIALKPNA
jgi:hypothetical protein